MWKNLLAHLGITTHQDDHPKKVYRDHHSFIPVFSKLNLKKNLGEEIFEKINQLEIWKGSISSKQQEKDFEWKNFFLSDFELQKNEDQQDHFYKKIVGKDLILIFITENRWNSKIYRFYFSFNPDSFENKESFYETYSVDGTLFYYFSKNETKQQRSYDLSVIWNSLKSNFNKFFGIAYQKKSFEDLCNGMINYYIERDLLKLNQVKIKK